MYLRDKHEVAWSDCAVLYRGNHQARPLEKALQLSRIPYRLTGALSFLDRAEVKDVLAYLRLIANPDDDAAVLRVVNVPRRESGATTPEKLGELAQAKHLSMLRAAHSPTVLQQLSARPPAARAGLGPPAAPLPPRAEGATWPRSLRCSTTQTRTTVATRCG